ncbi:MAG: hypothetical protein E6H07_12680 [Bacteroidetes bacterium]|nr:MAG: hypothetical protein E6H07_12680 [Bacteroidota bacterium]
MRKTILPIALFLSVSVFLASCKNDEYLLTPPPISDQSFSEEFETTSGATGNGWTFINKSSPIGAGGWIGGTFAPTLPLFSGSGYAYSFNTVAQGDAGYTIESTISNWIVSKPIMLQNGDKIVFYTNSLTLDLTATGLELRMNKHNNGTNVGDGDDPGDFDETLTTVNTFQTVNAADSYPTTWTRFEGTVRGLNKPVEGRIALRYFVPHNYQYNAATTIVAVDRFTYTSVKK